MPQGSEGRFDRVGGADALPVFRREIVERHQRRSILDQTFDSIRGLGLIDGDEGVERPNRVASGLRLPEVMKCFFRVGLGTCRKPVQHGAQLVHPATLVTGFRPQFQHRIPDSHGAVTDGRLRCVHARRGHVRQPLLLALTGFPETWIHRQQVLTTAVANSDHDQHTKFAKFSAETVIVTIGPDIHPDPNLQ